ncbi:general odorant-binding protein 56h-like [Teleopsis dalmanni]|uniref:general odorant-binding protein 56h-like n=1 Tax=Teleopsis dalmanni TaxID=139649 RepID=UPI000D32ACB5|nr:general odorant-binding protein 56h-like [Teleopsis dalmanni]XP_037955373.1 general odorant-binding protein 56h-like [Teleopsis dalmanni]
MRAANLWSFVFVIFIASVMSGELHPEMVKMAQDCLKEYNLEENEVNKLQWDNIDFPSVKDDIKCATKCFFEKSKYMDSAGNFNADSAKKDFESDKKLVQIIDECKVMEYDNSCEKAFRILACVVQKKM